jgi:transposase
LSFVPGPGPQGHDADLYKERNAVERLINRLKDMRGIATRFDLRLRASMIWINDLLRATG